MNGAPTVTQAQIDAIVASSDIDVSTVKVFGKPATLVHLKTPDGFLVTKCKTCVCPENYDEETGKGIALAEIQNELWGFEGYKLAALIPAVAKACHEANKAYCESLGDDSQPAWKDAPQWQKDSAINGVKFHMMNPESTPEDSHINWTQEKAADGWKYGPKKDPEAKEHPCMVPYEELPEAQRAKDAIFVAIVKSMI